MREVIWSRGIKERFANLHVFTKEWVDACDISLLEREHKNVYGNIVV